MKSQRFLPVLVVAASLVLSILACDSGSSGGGATSAPVGKDISGSYTVTGTTLDGQEYAGDATITQNGSSYDLTWTIGPGSQTGTGTLSGDTFTVEWTDGTFSGDGTYTLNEDGSLEGTWTQDGESGEGTETLTPN